MKRQNKKRLIAAAFAGVPALVVSQSAVGQTIWTGSDSALWNDVNNWNTVTVPGTGSTAEFASSSSSNNNVSLNGGSQAIGMILFDSTPTSFDLGSTGGDTFVFDSGGIIKINSDVLFAQTLGAAIQTTGSMSVTNSGGAGMTFGGNITINGGGTLTITNTPASTTTTLNGNITDNGGVGSLALVALGTGSGNNNNFVINGINTYSGATTISVNTGNTGSIQIGSDEPFGSAKVTINIETNSPQFKALNGTRTISNALDINGGPIFVGTNSFKFTGPINVINAAAVSRTFNLLSTSGISITLGAAGTSASTITLGNPVSNGGNNAGKTLILAAGANGAYIINDAMQDPASGGGTSSGNVTEQGLGGFLNNSQSTYSGSANLTGGGTIIEIGANSTLLGSTIVSGPFGVGTITYNNNAANPLLEAYGADRTVANPINLISGLSVSNAATTGLIGDSSGPHNLTLSGPITATASNRTLTNNMAGGVALYLGAATSPSTLTFGSTLAFQTSSSGGGLTVVNDLVNDNGNNSGTILGQNNAIVQLTNANNSYTGGDIVNSGATINVSADGDLGASSGTVSIGGGTLLSTGTFSSARGITLNTGTNTIDATGTNVLTLNGAITGTGDLTKGTNSGVVQLAQSSGYSTSGNINVNGGTLLVGPTGGETGALSVGNTLTINGGATVSVAAGAPSYSVTNSAATLTINGSGQLNLANSALLTTTPLSTVQQYLINGYNNGAWNGTGGINSVNAAADHTANGNAAVRALGYSSGTTWASLGLSAGQTLVKYTIYGDANLDGSVDITDLNTVLSNFLSGNPGTWDTGDFNYDGTVDITDLNYILSNYLSTAPTTVRTAGAKASASVASTGNTAHTLTGTASPSANPPAPGNGQLELIVNTNTGDVQIVGNNADIASLQITSASSGIITANWTDLHSQGYSNWADTAKKKNGIGEFDNQFTVSGDFALINGTIDYGNIYNFTANGEDYVFKYGSVESNGVTVDTDVGSVFYVAGVPEPTTLGLMGLAAAGLMSRRRRQSQYRSLDTV